MEKLSARLNLVFNEKSGWGVYCMSKIYFCVYMGIDNRDAFISEKVLTGIKKSFILYQLFVRILTDRQQVIEGIWKGEEFDDYHQILDISFHNVPQSKLWQRLGKKVTAQKIAQIIKTFVSQYFSKSCVNVAV